MSSIEKTLRKARVGLAALQDSLDTALIDLGPVYCTWASSKVALFLDNTNPQWPEFRSYIRDVIRRGSLGHWKVVKTYMYSDSFTPRHKTYTVVLQRDLGYNSWKAELYISCRLHPKH